MLGVLSLVSVVSILEYFGSLYSCYNLVLVIEFNLFLSVSCLILICRISQVKFMQVFLFPCLVFTFCCILVAICF